MFSYIKSFTQKIIFFWSHYLYHLVKKKKKYPEIELIEWTEFFEVYISPY